MRGWALRGLLCFFSSLAMATTGKPPPIQVAVTIDDLPANGVEAPGESRLDVAHQMIAALQKHKLTRVFGFVNSFWEIREPGYMQVLSLWHDAGFLLGNHTYHHWFLDQVSAVTFQNDILLNEKNLRFYSAAENFKVFRFPGLKEGATHLKRATIREFLKKQNYQIAEVTLEFADWAYSSPYARCLQNQDAASLARLKTAYLNAAVKNLLQSRDFAVNIFGRPIPHILLLHISAFNAEMMDSLLTAFEAQGVQFVTLEEAMKDPAYQLEPTVPLGSSNFLELAYATLRPHLTVEYPETMPPALGGYCWGKK